MDRRLFWELVDGLESSGRVADRTRLYQFMRCCCRSFPELLPREAERWLAVADGYRAGEVSASDLLAARVDAWGYLGADSCDFASPRVNAVRAVLCLLSPDDDPCLEDASLVVSHFVDFCEGAGLSTEGRGRCLAEAYGLSLGGRVETGGPGS